MQNFQNEGLVIVDTMLTKAENVCFKSTNEIIDVRITENNGPELICNDGSHIIFSSYSQYYSFISNKHEKVYDTDTKILDTEKMDNLYFVKDDDVVDVIYRNKMVFRVGLYYIDDQTAPIYKFYTN